MVISVVRRRGPVWLATSAGAAASLLAALGAAAFPRSPGPVPGRIHAYVGSGPAAAPVPPKAPRAISTRARDILALYLRRGLREKFVATETTRLLRGRVRISQQTVKHAGAGRTRIEYLAPPALRGDVLLISAGRIMKYSPRTNRIQVGPIMEDGMFAGAAALLGNIHRGGLSVDVVGNEIVAGQTAAIVEIRARGGSYYKRLWIDEKTGVRLRIEDTDPQGNPVSTSQYTAIDYNAEIDPRDFRPDSLPNVPKEPLLPVSAPLLSVEQARRLVGYPILEPELPAGFHLTGAWVMGRGGPRSTAILRYSDAVNTITLFEQPVAVRRGAAPAAPGLSPRWRGGFLAWTTASHRFFLVGNVRADAVQRIVDSLRQ